MNDAAARPQRQQRPVIGCPGAGSCPIGMKISEAGGAPNEIDLAADCARRDIDCVIEHQAAARVHLAVAQIERLGQTDRADEIRCVAEQSRVDIGARHFNMTSGQNQADFVLFRYFPGEIEAQCRSRILCNRRNRK